MPNSTLGAPTSYKASYAKKLQELVDEGVTKGVSLVKLDIARHFGVQPRTIDRWAERYSDFGQLVRDAVRNTHRLVEGKVLEAALNGNMQAAFFWLKCQLPHKWRDAPINNSEAPLVNISLTHEDKQTIRKAAQVRGDLEEKSDKVDIQLTQDKEQVSA